MRQQLQLLRLFSSTSDPDMAVLVDAAQQTEHRHGRQPRRLRTAISARHPLQTMPTYLPAMFGTSAEPLTYDAGWSPEFRRLADLVLVAEGRELPTHSQVMARESKARRGLLPSAEAVEGPRR